MSNHFEHIKELEKLIESMKEAAKLFPDDPVLPFAIQQLEGRKAELNDNFFICTDCGAEGYHGHFCEAANQGEG